MYEIALVIPQPGHLLPDTARIRQIERRDSSQEGGIRKKTRGSRK
jgi:hypothetical protein